MKTAIFVIARLKSTRLPRKVLKDIQGRPMIGHMLDRLKLAQRPEQIVLCTSTVAQDDPLEKFAVQEGIPCFRGDPEDVLQRKADCAKAFGVQTIISCTADNPFVDPTYIDLLADFHHQNHNDFSKVEGLPWGAFSYALDAGAVRRACEIKAESDTEVWGAYFTQTGLFRWSALEVTDPEVRWPELRVTVDTPEDFELISQIFDELYRPDHVFSLQEIVDLCRKRPDLVAINSRIEQKAALPIQLKEGVLPGDD